VVRWSDPPLPLFPREGRQRPRASLFGPRTGGQQAPGGGVVVEVVVEDTVEVLVVVVEVPPVSLRLLARGDSLCPTTAPRTPTALVAARRDHAKTEEAAWILSCHGLLPLKSGLCVTQE